MNKWTQLSSDCDPSPSPSSSLENHFALDNISCKTQQQKWTLGTKYVPWYAHIHPIGGGNLTYPGISHHMEM